MWNSRRVVAVLGCALTACHPPTDTAPPAPIDNASDAAEAAEAYRLTFENPGGMWMPSQMADHAETLESLGIRLDPIDLTDPTRFPLGAVVSLGGCSGSFVSPDGLIITNHHCVGNYLQFHSTPEVNLIRDGFLAQTLEQEKPGRPRDRVFVTRGSTDVTAQVLAGLGQLPDDHARSEAISRRTDALARACEARASGTRCRVASFFEGAQFVEIEQLELQDVRLVYAPHPGIGVFGGEVDNWRWPRHTGDWAFLRAYQDGAPYHPPHHLKISATPLRPHDLVFVAGYPAQTHRLQSAAELAEAARWTYPHLIERFEETIDLLESFTSTDEALAIEYDRKLRVLHNYATNFRGMREGLNRPGLIERRTAEEDALVAWIDADATRAERFAEPVRRLRELHATNLLGRRADTISAEILRASDLLGVALTIVSWTDHHDPTDDPTPGFRPEDLETTAGRFAALDDTFDPRVDRALLEAALARAATSDPGSEILVAIVGNDMSSKAIAARVDTLFEGTRLLDPQARVEMLRTTTRAELEGHPDPLIALAARLHPLVDAQRHRGREFEGATAAVVPRYIEALRAFEAERGVQLSPDANRTLRITYGTVRGYRPSPDAPVYEPFTTVPQMLAKHTGEAPFDAPARLLEVAREASNTGTWGPYLDAELGAVPLDFLTDLDITGGNSGSATLDAHGDLVGLAFDGNYEAISSDWVFLPEITRSIHVDIRYVAWVMDAVDQADHLLREMGVTPRL